MSIKNILFKGLMMPVLLGCLLTGCNSSKGESYIGCLFGSCNESASKPCNRDRESENKKSLRLIVF